MSENQFSKFHQTRTFMFHRNLSVFQFVGFSNFGDIHRQVVADSI